MQEYNFDETYKLLGHRQKLALRALLDGGPYSDIKALAEYMAQLRNHPRLTETYYKAVCDSVNRLAHRGLVLKTPQNGGIRTCLTWKGADVALTMRYGKKRYKP